MEIVLQDDGEFDVLQAAVIRAGLVDALNGTTPYTVFAPTDLAFVTTLGVADESAAIAAVNNLPVDALKNILLYQVTQGRRNSASVLGAPGYQMLNGATLTRATLSAAGIAATDIPASNGIVHVINAVLLPLQNDGGSVRTAADPPSSARCSRRLEQGIAPQATGAQYCADPRADSVGTRSCC